MRRLDKTSKLIDSASIRYYAGNYVYRIGQRVMTPEGPATITGFDPQEFLPIIVRLDVDDREMVGDASTITPLDED